MIKTENGVKILEFGYGSIGVGNAYSSDDPNKLENEVNFWEGDPGPIGRSICTAGETTDTIPVQVRMFFNKSESVQIVIDHLEHCKKCLQEAGK